MGGIGTDERSVRKTQTYLAEGFEYGYNVPRALLCVLGVLALTAVLTGEPVAIPIGVVCGLAAIAGLAWISHRRRTKMRETRSAGTENRAAQPTHHRPP